LIATPPVAGHPRPNNPDGLQHPANDDPCAGLDGDAYLRCHEERLGGGGVFGGRAGGGCKCPAGVSVCTFNDPSGDMTAIGCGPADSSGNCFFYECDRATGFVMEPLGKGNCKLGCDPPH